MSPEEEDLICKLHHLLGDRWGLIADRLPNRRAEEVELMMYSQANINIRWSDKCSEQNTNRTTARIFPAVLDVVNPEFKRKLDRMVEINEKLLAVGESEDISLVKNLKRVPLIAALVSEILAAYLMPPIESGSVVFPDFEPRLVY